MNMCESFFTFRERHVAGGWGIIRNVGFCARVGLGQCWDKLVLLWIN